MAGAPGFNMLLNPSVNVILTWDVTPCSLTELYLAQVTRLFHLAAFSLVTFSNRLVWSDSS
jgi:hypothetical protein